MKRLILSLFLLLAPCAFASTTIAVNASEFQASLTAYNWDTNGSTYARTINCGAYFRGTFTGTSASFGVDTSEMAPYTAEVYPVVKWSIDGGAYTTAQLTNGQTSLSLATGLADTSHTLLFIFKGMNPNGELNRWQGKNALKLTNMVLDTGKALTGTIAAGAPYLAYGDSITEGFDALGSNVSHPSLVMDASVGYQALLASYAGVEYGDVAFSGQGFLDGSSGVPGMTTSYNLKLESVSRTFSPVPAFVSINCGSNYGLDDPATLVTFLGTVRSAVTASPWIFLIVPFNQAAVTNIVAAYGTYHTANPADKCVLLNLGSAGASIVTNNSADGGLHPNVTGHQLLAAALWPLMQPYIGRVNSRPDTSGLLLISRLDIPRLYARREETNPLAA